MLGRLEGSDENQCNCESQRKGVCVLLYVLSPRTLTTNHLRFVGFENHKTQAPSPGGAEGHRPQGTYS